MKTALIMALLLATGLAGAEELELSPAEGATLHAMATDVQTIEEWSAELDGCPLEHGKLHDLSVAQSMMPRELRNRLVVQDGWMNPFKAWCNDQQWAILSFGEDGRPDLDYARLPELGDTHDDFVIVDGEFGAAPGHVRILVQAGKQRRTMADIRSIGIVFESYAIDNEVYPGGPVTQMEPISRVLPQAQPVYIRKLPLTDGWGNPFRYWSDGRSYRIASAGSDGIFETDYATQGGTGPFEPDHRERDIVFANGEFEQYPQPKEE